jgi:FecR protein
MQFSWKNPLRALPVLLLAGYAGAVFAAAAGQVQFVIGNVKLITKAGVTRVLVKGGEVDEGDRIIAAAGGSAQIRMIDGGFIAIRPNTNMVFDTYHYDGKADGTEHALLSLFQGGFRAITGAIGHIHKQNYLIKTATATIGIRGTDHEPMVILPPAPGHTAIGEPGTYDKVNVGIAYIRTEFGSINIQRNQVGFAPITRAPPVILPKIPPFYTATPAPEPQKTAAAENGGGQHAATTSEEKAAATDAATRSTDVVDPTSAVATAPVAAPVATAPATVAPVVAITATSTSGTTLNATTQTTSTGTNGTSTPLTPTTPTTAGVVNFSSTSVLRDEILWPTTQIATGANPAVTTYIVSDKNKESLVNNSGGTPNTPLTTPLTTPVTLTGPTTNTNFLFDSSGNLTQVLSTPHVVFDHGKDVPGSSTQFAAPTPLADAQLSFSGGTAETYYSAGTGIRFGRWTGGGVDVTDSSTGTSYSESLASAAGTPLSAQWLVAQMPSSLPTTGVFQYTRITDTSGAPSFATAPTDSYGNVGTLERAGLTADFTNMKVSAGVAISMPSGPGGSLGVQNLGAIFSNAPISNGGFNVSSGSDNPTGTDNLHVGCYGTGCAPNQNYGGRIRGGFDSATGNAGSADGAFFRYTFNTNYESAGITPPAGRIVDDYVNGLVAFQQGSQVVLPTSAAYPVAAPTAPVVAVATYQYNDAVAGGTVPASQSYWVDNPQTGLVTDAAGNLVSVTEPSNAQHGDGNALALSGGTATPATPTALAIGSTASATDGSILLGWQAPSPTLSVSGIDFNGCFGTSGCSAPSRTVLGDGLSWVWGPAPFPDYLPGAIAGYSNSLGPVVPSVAVYTLGASMVHDQTGATGTVTHVALAANFDTSSIDFGMTATTAAGTWGVSAPEIRMSNDGSFSAWSSSGSTIASGTTVTPTSAYHDVTVTLTPTSGTASSGWGNIEGQLMGIGLGGAGVTFDLNSSTSCTSGPCPNTSASGALAFSNALPYSTMTPHQIVAFASGMNGAGQIDSSENYRINGGFVSPYRTQTVNGFPVAFDGELPLVETQGAGCTTNCTNVNQIPVRYAVAGASGVPSIGTATLLESGSDPTTGIRWGRYGGGTVGVTDRIGGTSLGTVDLTQQNTHFIMSAAQSGPTVLPITGTFTYTFAGGTTPTDSNGNVGTPLTAANASLTANFSNQTVNATLSNIKVGGNTWGASATGIPISGNVFQAEKKLGGGGNLSVTSSLGTNTSGQIAGAFTGGTGNGVGMLYSLNSGGNIANNPAAVTVSGVAAFRR